MPHVRVDDHRLWIREKGHGPPVVFVHGLFFDGRIFEPMTDALAPRFRTLNVDVRDHGRSDRVPRRWSLEDAAREILTALTELDVGPVHWVGLSMGGMIGLRAALQAPERIRSLALLDTSAESEPRQLLHKAMAHVVRLGGAPAVRGLLPYAVGQMFSESFAGTPTAERWVDRIRTSDPEALYRACMAVFDRGSVVDRIGRLEQPALVLVGEEDRATPPEHGQRLVEALPDARLVRVPGAGHMTPLEAPDQVTDALERFLRPFEIEAIDRTSPV